MVTGLHERTCLLLLMAGKNMRDWKDGLKDVSDWAIQQGCNELLIHGRKGWSKALGFEITGRDELDLHIMRKKL